jgi:hypothetical protein
MSHRRKLVLAAIVLILVVIGGGVILLNRGAQPAGQAVVTPSPTASVDLLGADRPLVERLSKELAAKYRTFTKVDQAYADTLRPYVTPEYLSNYQSTFRYADRAPFFQPVRSTAINVELKDATADTVTALVELESTKLSGGGPFKQIIRIDWRKTNGRWTATDVETAAILTPTPQPGEGA